MFSKLTRAKRKWAGRVVALLYLFCVLAPATALALGSGPAPCFDETVAVVHLHDDALLTVGHIHDRIAHHLDGAQHRHQADKAGATGGHEGHHGKGGPGPCCAMLCVPAMAADVPSIAPLTQQVSSCVAESHRTLHSKAPLRLYRPPIV